MPAKRYKVNLLPEERDALQRLVDNGQSVRLQAQTRPDFVES